MNNTATAALRELTEKYITGDIDLIGSPMYFEDKEDRINAFVVDLTALINEHYVAKEDIATEVERRIAERLPSDEEIVIYGDWHSRKYDDDDTHKSIAYTACKRTAKWLRSRLTENKQEGGGRTLTADEMKQIYNNGKPLCKDLHEEGGDK